MYYQTLSQFVNSSNQFFIVFSKVVERNDSLHSLVILFKFNVTVCFYAISAHLTHTLLWLDCIHTRFSPHYTTSDKSSWHSANSKPTTLMRENSFYEVQFISISIHSSLQARNNSYNKVKVLYRELTNIERLQGIIINTKWVFYKPQSNK